MAVKICELEFVASPRSIAVYRSLTAEAETRWLYAGKKESVICNRADGFATGKSIRHRRSKGQASSKNTDQEKADPLFKTGQRRKTGVPAFDCEIAG